MVKERKRKLNDGTIVDELEQAVTLKVHTKCPAKWTLIDTETGQVYQGQPTEKYGKMWKMIDTDLTK